MHIFPDISVNTLSVIYMLCNGGLGVCGFSVDHVVIWVCEQDGMRVEECKAILTVVSNVWALPRQWMRLSVG